MPGSASIFENPCASSRRPLAGRLAVGALRGLHQRVPRRRRPRRTARRADSRTCTSPVTRCCVEAKNAFDVAADRVEVLAFVHQVAVGRRRATSLMRCWRADSTSFSSSRCAVSSTSAAGASNATRPLKPMIVSPRWMPRPMPNCAPMRLDLLDQRDRVERRAPSSEHGHAGLEADRVPLRRRAAA